MNIQRSWFQQSRWLCVLRPLSFLFGVLSKKRRIRLSKQSSGPDCPIVVVGNIAVGGSGKTPFLMALIEIATEQGLRVGVVSRGYGGVAKDYPIVVDQDSLASQVGDEPLMIAQKMSVPVVVDPDRVQAAHCLASQFDIDLIFSDDGLQHYAMKRDLEICVVDGHRGLGNQKLLPQGPLREGVERLNEVDLVVINGEGKFDYNPAVHFTLKPEALHSLEGYERQETTPDVVGSKKVYAVAGIGDPSRFFNTLRSLGFDPIECPLGDHATLSDDHWLSMHDYPIIMTDKDAVKYRSKSLRNAWSLSVQAYLDDSSRKRLSAILKELPYLIGDKDGS